MPDRIRVACAQMTSRADKAPNLETAERLVAQAAATGADLVVLPEKWNAIGNAQELHAAAESLEDGECVEAMAEWSRRHGITLVGGSITERREGRQKLSNTSLVFDSEGQIVATYRKIHLFDVEVGGVVYRESEAEEPGEEPVVVPVELSRRTSRPRPARTTGTSSCGRGRSRTSCTSPRRPRSARRCPGSPLTAAR